MGYDVLTMPDRGTRAPVKALPMRGSWSFVKSLLMIASLMAEGHYG
jgi:hypothetical protein